MIFKIIASIVIFFLGGNEPKGNPKTVVQRKKIARIQRLFNEYKNTLCRAQVLYADLAEEFGVDSAIAEDWAESIHDDAQLIENAQRQVSEAIANLKAEIELIEAKS